MLCGSQDKSIVAQWSNGDAIQKNGAIAQENDEEMYKLSAGHATLL